MFNLLAPSNTYPKQGEEGLVSTRKSILFPTRHRFVLPKFVYEACSDCSWLFSLAIDDAVKKRLLPPLHFSKLGPKLLE